MNFCVFTVTTMKREPVIQMQKEVKGKRTHRMFCRAFTVNQEENRLPAAKCIKLITQLSTAVTGCSSFRAAVVFMVAVSL